MDVDTRLQSEKYPGSILGSTACINPGSLYFLLKSKSNNNSYLKTIKDFNEIMLSILSLNHSINNS